MSPDVSKIGGKIDRNPGSNLIKVLDNLGLNFGDILEAKIVCFRHRFGDRNLRAFWARKSGPGCRKLTEPGGMRGGGGNLFSFV